MTQTIKFITIFDVEREQIAEVYAKALLGASEKAGNSEQVQSEFDAFISEFWDRAPQLEAVLSSPRVPTERKLAMLDRIARGKVSAIFLNFLKVVATRHRMDCLRAMHRAVLDRFAEMTGRVEVQIMTAEAVGNELNQHIGGRLEQVLGRKVAVASVINPEMIGGIMVRVGDTVYDSSVLNRLEKLRAAAVTRTSEAIRTAQTRFGIREGETRQNEMSKED